MISLHKKELEAAIEVHNNQWEKTPHNPISFYKIGANRFMSIGACRYLYDGKTWKQI